MLADQPENIGNAESHGDDPANSACGTKGIGCCDPFLCKSRSITTPNFSDFEKPKNPCAAGIAGRCESGGVNLEPRPYSCTSFARRRGLHFVQKAHCRSRGRKPPTAAHSGANRPRGIPALPQMRKPHTGRRTPEKVGVRLPYFRGWRSGCYIVMPV